MRKHCRRRHYALVNPISLAIAGASMTAEADLDKLRMRELSAIACFAKGAATPSDFRDVCDMLNLCETMAEQGIGPEARAAVDAAQTALLAAKERHDTHGRLAIDGPGLMALRELYSWHDAQRTAIDRSTYERAIQRATNKIRSASPSVRVLT